MSDLLFRCPKCAKGLCVSDRSSGKIFSCPDCHTKVTAPEPEIAFDCPSCGDQLCSASKDVGQGFSCPRCSKPVVVPKGGDIKFKCTHCGQRIKVSEDMVGMTVECPTCKQQVEIPAVVTVRGIQPSPKPAEPAKPSVPPQPLCPNCNVRMAPEAVICTACGFDRRTGQVLRTQTPPSPILPKVLIPSIVRSHSSDRQGQKETTMPDIGFLCPHCDQTLKAPDAMAGEVIGCPSCGKQMQIPESEEGSPMPEPPPDANAWEIPRQQDPAKILIFLGALLIFGISAVLVVPSLNLKGKHFSWNFGNPKAQQEACVNNLRQIDAAKEQAALAEKLGDNDLVDESVANKYIKGNTTPLCPAGGRYSYRRIGESPRCSVPGHRLPGDEDHGAESTGGSASYQLGRRDAEKDPNTLMADPDEVVNMLKRVKDDPEYARGYYDRSKELESRGIKRQ